MLFRSHKISSITIDNELKELHVNVKSYINQASRNKEKTIRQKELRIKEIMDTINSINSLPENERDVNLVISLTEENNNLISELNYNETTDLYIREQHKLTFITEVGYILDFIDDISTEFIYNKLKLLDVFKDSIDV